MRSIELWLHDNRWLYMGRDGNFCWLKDGFWHQMFLVLIQSPVQGPCCVTDVVFPKAVTCDVIHLFLPPPRVPVFRAYQ